jgi:O-antigen/teichoic acid export membrane protein
MIYLRVAVILVLFRAAIDIYLAFYRAEGHAWAYSAVMISQHHLSIFFSVIFTLYVFHGLLGVYVGMILGEGIVTVLFFILLFRDRMIKKPEWEGESVRSIVQYGAPLLISSIATLVMNLGDRYVIQYYLDMESVANYSVPYQMALLVMTILFGPIRQMFFPYLFSLYESKGIDEAGKAVSSAIRYLFIFMIPAAFGLSYLGRDIIVVIASEKYADAASLLPCLLLGLFSYGAYNAVLSSVPLLFKKTGTISLLTCLGAGINILLNIVLIPFYGIWGAAIATAATYLFLLFSTYVISRSYIKIEIDFMVILKAVVFSSVMLGVLRMMGDFSSYLLLTVIGKCLVGALVYGLLQAVFGEGLEKTRLLFRKVIPLQEEGPRP